MNIATFFYIIDSIFVVSCYIYESFQLVLLLLLLMEVLFKYD